ncbi:YggS family pyridoxal phosphate-dependent enzyme [bacterium endosymbiont of Pedicinus badii]|uniref:YggS family pyridoxal phosphate-dependent enzyme n=1 Tax=bacterium endosymbiont of Pedicinus badii TaxID=1719126 RepID=UPI0009B9887D|nr:YggS family pyridoxal phosphate-dependent enzyme [bacterium endosymbiont of Pedicinus badii]OQM34021.1 hypothetical protein AOQ89_01515 [bacterium endosymbiont of Pedicinus badii]
MNTQKSKIKKNFFSLKRRIKEISKKNFLSSKKITILVVTKGRSLEEMQSVLNCKNFNFGENYVQESIKKINFFKKEKKISWHFIGNLQSNKSSYVAKNFDWYHSLNSFKIADRIEKQRPNSMKPIKVLIQLNVDKRENNFGVSEENAFLLANYIKKFKNLDFSGIMVMPKIEKSFTKQIKKFLYAKEIFDKLKKVHPQISVLSMGTTQDMQSAIISGSNLIRIGSGIFE